jgi:hypothetical protein
MSKLADFIFQQEMTPFVSPRNDQCMTHKIGPISWVSYKFHLIYVKHVNNCCTGTLIFSNTSVAWRPEWWGFEKWGPLIMLMATRVKVGTHHGLCVHVIRTVHEVRWSTGPNTKDMIEESTCFDKASMAPRPLPSLQ